MMARTEFERVTDANYKGRCPRCGSGRWVSISLDGGYSRLPQCVPCGKTHSRVRLLVGDPPPRPTYRVHITGGGTTPGLHQSSTVRACSVGEAIDTVITETGAADADGSHWTITAERLPDGSMGA